MTSEIDHWRSGNRNLYLWGLWMMRSEVNQAIVIGNEKVISWLQLLLYIKKLNFKIHIKITKNTLSRTISEIIISIYITDIKSDNKYMILFCKNCLSFLMFTMSLHIRKTYSLCRKRHKNDSRVTWFSVNSTQIIVE